MILEKVIGIRCENLRPGMFRDERVVSISGRDYFVDNSNLVIRDDFAYVKRVANIKIERYEEGYIVVANVDDEANSLFVKEGDLVIKSSEQ